MAQPIGGSAASEQDRNTKGESVTMFGVNSSADEPEIKNYLNNSQLFNKNLKATTHGLPPKPLRNTFTAIQEETKDNQTVDQYIDFQEEIRSNCLSQTPKKEIKSPLAFDEIKQTSQTSPTQEKMHQSRTSQLSQAINKL